MSTTPSQRTSLEAEARALGSPTRFRIFEHIAGADHLVGVAELTELLGLNHNAIRQHLVVLKDAGLVIERPERRATIGRPRALYELNPEVRGSWGTPGPNEELAMLLSETIRSGLSPREVGRRAGRRRARGIAVDHGDIEAALRADLVVSGFRPQEVVSSARTCFILGRCPYANVASLDPETVCQLHLGLAEGIAQGIDGNLTAELVAMDPRRAGCRLSVVPAGPRETRH